jgi:hypothetical protein
LTNLLKAMLSFNPVIPKNVNSENREELKIFVIYTYHHMWTHHLKINN